MKFLVDAQLPVKLAQLLRQKGYNTIHTKELPEQNKTPDGEINRLSIEQQRVVITKDLDGCIPLWQPGKYDLMSRPIEVLNFKPLPNEYNYSMSKLGCSRFRLC